MQRTTRVLAILSASWALTACSSLTVRAPTCQLPPPPSLPSDCPNLPAINDPSFGALYQQSLRDAVQYQECRANLRNYTALMQYRETICPTIQNQLQQNSGSMWNPLNWFK